MKQKINRNVHYKEPYFVNDKITLVGLKFFLKYDSKTGLFHYKYDRDKYKKGDVAGRITDKGYVSIKLKGSYYFAHRLAILYMTGKWPSDQIDHRDGIKTNNKYKNLRIANNTINTQNIKNKRKNSSSSYLGVNKDKTRWRARIQYEGKPIFIGSFNTPEEAYKAYLKAKKKYHKGYV